MPRDDVIVMNSVCLFRSLWENGCLDKIFLSSVNAYRYWILMSSGEIRESTFWPADWWVKALLLLPGLHFFYFLLQILMPSQAFRDITTPLVLNFWERKEAITDLAGRQKVLPGK